MFVHNVRSLSKYIDDIVSDDRIINNDIIDLYIILYYIQKLYYIYILLYILLYTETQIKPSDSTFKIMETLNFFNINFNNDENKI